MHLEESFGVNYQFINLMSEEIILFRNDKVFIINDAMLQLLGGEANRYIGEPIHNLVMTSIDIMGMIRNAQEYKENNFSGIIKKFNEEKTFITFSISLLDEITYMLIVKGKKEKVNDSLCFQFDCNREFSEKSCFWILNSAWDAIYIHDEKEKIIFANKSAVKLAGFSNCEEIVGKKLMDIMTIHPDYKDEISKRRDSVLCDTTALPSFEQKLIRRDGTEIIAEISALSYLINGSKNVMLIARDITEKKQAVEDRIQLEEALEYDKLKTEFFSNISHEFRTPLNIILGTLQLIDAMHTKPEKCEYFDRFNGYFKMMRQNCYRLLRLINNLMDITRIDSGFLNINLKNNDIVSEVEDICQSVVEYAELNGLTILFDTDVEEKVMAFDSDKIEKIMINLLSNAIKFNNSGGRIDINIYDKHQSIIISVKDNGIGIPEEMKEKVFDRFIQVDNLFTRAAEGSGLGLSLVRSLVKAHGGTIKVESELNKGSNFIVELPVLLLKENENKDIEYQFTAQNKIERINIELSDIYSVVQ